MASNSTMIHKLQSAINMKAGGKLLYSTSQFYSDKQDRPITVYQLKRAVWDEEKQKNKNVELFQTTSQIQMVLYLRDMWYELNGWEVPTDNPVWEEKKAKMQEEQKNGKQKRKQASE